VGHHKGWGEVEETPAKPDEDVCRHVQQVAHVAEAAIAAVEGVC